MNQHVNTDINKILRESEDQKNIVVKVTNLSLFEKVLPAILPQKDILYIHFSEKALLSEKRDGLKLCTIPLTHRFEAFTVAVYEAVRELGEGCLILFDSLSELRTAWATDMMMENFFTVITPLVRETGARAFYPLIRNMHPARTFDGIRDHADMVIDLYSDIRNLYLRAETIRGYDEEELYLPCLFEGEEGFRVIHDGVRLSRFQKAMNKGFFGGRDLGMDSWDRFFDQVQMKFMNGQDIEEDCGRICNIMMSRDEKIRRLIRKHFMPEDYFYIKEHMIGTGLIGGKACGMLTARKIVENESPELFDKLEPHNSFYIGSDVFYTYLVENGLWDLRVKQRKPEGYFSAAKELSEGIMQGQFSAKLEEEFMRLLEYYGSSPVIVRSSSILEDGFGNAFAGKYESVFCSSNGSIEERLRELEDAIRTVYASALSPSALDYRLRRGLENRDEQMALLVQRVSGSYYDDYYFPCAAGVGYSYSAYRFLESLDPHAGMLRLVMGLGTTAVDRLEGSYPRLVSLDKPEATSFSSVAEHHRYSQRNIEVVDRGAGKLRLVPASQVQKHIPDYLKKLLYEHDAAAEMQFLNRGSRRDILFISCSGLTANKELMQDMKTIMEVIDREYGQPVDIEYTINLASDGEYVINLLQCRPLQVFQDQEAQEMPEDAPADRVVADIYNSSMGLSGTSQIDWVCYVDPVAYYEMPYQNKYEVTNAISRVNRFLRDQEGKAVLMVPGRVGTTSPELGVPAAFADLSEFGAVFELAESRVGYNPELSYGSHMFQDFVENETLYAAVFEDGRTASFWPDKISSLPNRLGDLFPELAGLSRIVGLYKSRDIGLTLYHNLYEGHLLLLLEGGRNERENV